MKSMLLLGLLLTATARADDVLMVALTDATCDTDTLLADTPFCTTRAPWQVVGLDLGAPSHCVQPAALTPMLEQLALMVIPNRTAVHQAWQKYGSCAPIAPADYVRLLHARAENLNLPKWLGRQSRHLSQQALIGEIAEQGGLPSVAIQLHCQAERVTTIGICYHANAPSRCPASKNPCPANVRAVGKSP